MKLNTPTKFAGSNGKPARPRRGISLLIVVLLVSLAMAVSFSVIHSQGTALAIQQNADLRASARQAAMTGMAVALREANSPDWIGVGASFAKDLSPSERFTVTYSTGDAALSDGDSEYDEYAYRVTIRVNGLAKDPRYTDRKASHRIEAVIRLVPQTVDDEPTGWDEIQYYTFCQREKDAVSLTVPCRIEGPVRIRGKLDLRKDRIDWTDDVREWYLNELYWMYRDGGPDYRPFNGPVHLTYGEQDLGTCGLLTGSLHVPIADTSKDKLYEWSDPLVYESYQLYPGGKTYFAELISGDISDTELKPNAKTNPLGIFICSGKIRLLGNVSLQGTLDASDSDDIEVLGDSNTLSSLTAPPYEHRGMPSDARFRLPTVVGRRNLKVFSGAKLAVNGLAMIKEKVEIHTAGQYETSVTVNGNVSAKWLRIDVRSEWDQSKSWWEDRLSIFRSLFFPSWYFPNWLNTVHGLNPQPYIQFKPDSDTTRYHWYNGENPLFQAPSDGEGLTWELIRWTDNP